MTISDSNIKDLSFKKLNNQRFNQWQLCRTNAYIYRSENFSVFVGDYYFEQDTIINVTKDKSEIVLFCDLNGVRHTYYEDINSEIPLQSGQYNLLFTNNNRNKLYFPKEIQHKSLVIYFSSHFFINLTQDFNSHLDTFLNAIDKQIPQLVSQQNLSLSPKMNILILELIEEVKTNKNTLNIQALVYRLLYLQLEKLICSDTNISTLSTLDKAKIEQVRQLLINELHYNTTIKEISKIVGLNITKLKTLFPKIHGLPPKKYQLDYRMEQAKERLLMPKSDLTIAEIAYSAGYEYPEHFTRSFKKHFGYPPIALRNNKTPLF